MTTFIAQYKLLFFLSWIGLYLIFPAWALPISVKARASVFFGLMIYFCISAWLMNRWFNVATVDKPVIVRTKNWGDYLKNNLWLFIVCSIAGILHVYPIFFPILILGDEAIHLQSGLLVYKYIDSSWHTLFQQTIWILIVLALIIRTIKGKFNKNFSGFVKSNLLKNISIVLFFSFLVLWFFLLKDISYDQAFIRYPPVSKFIYFLTYSAFGIDRIFPRITQLIFYLLCSIYLYRTINLFYEKEAALLGAVIYLFLPISFAYAHLGELASGTVFFIVITSFYFMRFIKDGDSRDLLIAAYLIGIGCLYKKLNLLMFIICGTFLIVHIIKKRNFRSLIYFKILLLSLVPIIPWMLLTRSFSWRNYVFQLSNLIPPEGKIVTYLPMMASNLSEVVSGLAVLSIFYVCFIKRDTLTSFFGLLFIAYYFFIVSDMAALSPRFSLAFYPSIVVFLSVFIHSVLKRIKWKYAFMVFFAVLTMYLITISAVSPFNNRFLHIMNRKLLAFPGEKAMEWVNDNVKEGEKILTIRIMSYDFYRVKYGIDKNKNLSFWYNIEEILTPEKLKTFYRKNKASYIMFPYSPEYPYSRNSVILQYLKDNQGGEFMEIAKFSIDDNHIYIYKLKEI